MRLRLFILTLVTLHYLTAVAQTTEYQGASWQKLRSELSEFTIFGLGEAGHGYESINVAKSKLLDFLRQQLGVRSVVFESSFTLCTLAHLKGGTLESRLTYSLYPFWNTTPVQTALQPIYQMEQKDVPLITGCDVQEDCRYVRLSQYLISEGLIQTNIERLLASDSIMAYYIGKDFSRRSALSAEEYSILFENYEAVTRELQSAPLNDVKQKLLLRSVENRKGLCRYLTFSSTKERMYYRDSLMAANVVWLKKELYPEHKMVLWAANTHIAGLKKEDKQPQWMGEWFSGYYKGAYYPISFQKGSFTEADALEEELGVRYTSGADKYKAIVLLSNLKKISSKQWVTLCE